MARVKLTLLQLPPDSSHSISLSFSTVGAGERVSRVKTVKDAQRLLTQIMKEGDLAEVPISALLEELSAGSFNVTGPGSKLPVSQKVKALTRAEVTEIEANWEVVKRLKSLVDETSAASLAWRSKFGTVKGGSTLIQQLGLVNNTLKTKLNKAQAVLSKLAQRQIPKSIKGLVSNLSRRLPKLLQFEELSIQYYVTPGPKKSPQFYVYIGLKELQAEGMVYADYQIVLSILPDSQSKGWTLSYTTLPHFALPKSFATGNPQLIAEITPRTADRVINALKRQLVIDHVFLNSRMSLPSGLSVEKLHPAINSIKVVNDYVWVWLKRGIRADKLKEVNAAMTQAIEQALGLTRRPRLLTKTGKSTKTGRTYFRFSVESFSPEVMGWKMTTDKVKDLSELFDLGPADQVALRQALKHKAS